MSCSHRNYWTNSGLAGYYAAAQCEAGPTVDYDYGSASGPQPLVEAHVGLTVAHSMQEGVSDHFSAQVVAYSCSPCGECYCCSCKLTRPLLGAVARGLRDGGRRVPVHGASSWQRRRTLTHPPPTTPQIALQC